MKRTSTDPSVLLRRSTIGLEGFLILQVDNSLRIGSTAFLGDEDSVSKHFRFKPRTTPSTTTLTFNGSHLDRSNLNNIRMRQLEKIANLRSPTDQKEFASERAMAQYISVKSRPDILHPFNLSRLETAHRPTINSRP